LPSRAAARARRFVAHQRSAVRRLKRLLFGADGSLRHPYFRDLRRDYGKPVQPTTLERVHAAAAAADIVYVSDFHADPACQRFAADLVERLRSGRRLVLGVEFVYTRQQEILDRRQAGAIDDATFLRRIHYREEWGYSWEGFRELLDRARGAGVPVVALDRPPRGGFDGLARRDEHAARRIAATVAAAPRTRMIVLFGESHLASGHIPKHVARELSRRSSPRRAVRIFQDPEPVYWAALAGALSAPEAVRLRGGAFAVFHTPPLVRYESYRQELDRWRGEAPAGEDVDLTPAVHHLIDVLVGWMGIRAGRHRVRHRAGFVDDLQDAYPEVYSGPEAEELLRPILAEHGRTAQEIREARRLLLEREALYDARSNAVFLLRYLPGPAAGEAARFLRVALSGRLYRDTEAPSADPAERTFGAAINEALAYLGARLFDPASRAVTGNRGPAGPGAKARARWLEAFGEFVRSSAGEPEEAIVLPLRRSRELRRSLARDLGRVLGAKLYERLLDGRLTPTALRRLFTTDLDPPRAGREFVRLLRAR
jgi:Haem-binding uptake, Tiki superfamily, ChaN